LKHPPKPFQVAPDWGVISRSGRPSAVASGSGAEAVCQGASAVVVICRAGPAGPTAPAGSSPVASARRRFGPAAVAPSRVFRKVRLFMRAGSAPDAGGPGARQPFALHDRHTG